MALYEVLRVMSLLDGPTDGAAVGNLLGEVGLEVHVESVAEASGSTDFIRTTIPGERGRSAGGDAPTLGLVGRLGGIGARPGSVGLVSDGDGAVAAVAAALKLGQRARSGDRLPGDVAIATHICPDAPTEPHDPVPFMGSPVAMSTMNRLEVTAEMDVVLVVDTTKGNRILNWRGIAVTPTVVRGWILPVSPELLDVYESVCGTPPRVLPLSTYDITPYGNGLYHLNSIVQPAVVTDAPVVGVAITSETAVPGSSTNASHAEDIALAVSLCIEAAARFGAGQLVFYDHDEFSRAVQLYGEMGSLRTEGRAG